MAERILVSAGEASGDLYAATLIERLKGRLSGVEFFGCAGPRMAQAGVHPVVEASSIAVVGLAEVVIHIPRIWGEYRRLTAAARKDRPALAVLTDSPDFNLRLAARMKRIGVPVFYLVAPQVWAWRKGRLPAMRRNIDHLLCIFPFEEAFFRNHGISATYIGHPLARLVRPTLGAEEFRRKHGLNSERPLIALLPGSRAGEVARHLPVLLDAAGRIAAARPAQFALAAPAGGFVARELPSLRSFRERNPAVPIQVIEGESWDVLARAEVALAASGTVTIEAALLGTPMVVFYKVAGLSWLAGRLLVDVPFYSMVNLVAGRAVVPELMQNEMSGGRVAAEALRLLEDRAARDRMRCELAGVAAKLAVNEDPLERAAGLIHDYLRQARNQKT